MKRGILVAMLMMSVTVSAAEKRAPTNKEKAQQQPAGQKKTAPAELAELKTAKAKFMAAMGACAKPGSCDPSSRSVDKEATALLLEAEETFMVACMACAQQEKCEAERARIRDGKQSRGREPCK